MEIKKIELRIGDTITYKWGIWPEVETLTINNSDELSAVVSNINNGLCKVVSIKQAV